MVDGLRRARELRERHELLENVLNHIDDAVVVFAPDRTVVAFNRGSERAFGLSAAEVLGKAPALLGDDHAALLARTAAGGPLGVERELCRGDGRPFPARVHLVALRGEHDEHLAWLVVPGPDRGAGQAQQQLTHAEKLAAVGGSRPAWPTS
jgi:PAS domain S-box-containing protein